MVAARTLPMIAKPAVDPSARWALNIPDAIPDRSGGIEPIASLVAAATDVPEAMPTNINASNVSHR